MNAVKTMFDDIPEMIPVPKEFIHKKGEVIFIIDEDVTINKKSLKDFFGVLPDFPERASQGEFEIREEL